MGEKKPFLAVTIFFSVLAVAMIVASLATEHWIKATASIPGPHVNRNSSTNTPHADITLGLFSGQKNINFGSGERSRPITVKCKMDLGYCLLYNSTQGNKEDVQDEAEKLLNSIHSLFQNPNPNFNTSDADKPYRYGLFKYGYWLSTIVMAAIAIVWGLVSIGFTLFNVFGKPIETITGPLGLYLWNGCAFLFVLIAMVMYVVLYMTSFKYSVLTWADQNQGFKSEAQLDYSFYFLVVATASYLLNLILLLLSGYKLRCAFTREAEKVMDNGIILY